MHVLGDTRMTTVRSQLIEPHARSELDSEPLDPWTGSITPLFNGETFCPAAVSTLGEGVTRADITFLDLAIRQYGRAVGVLKRKFGEFKSLYGTCI